jgi:hypothetical protein
MFDTPITSNGKIARLPARMREEVNRRLHDGETGPVILAWLNGTPEAQEVCRKQFDSEPVSPQNLSAWRGGGFQKWISEQQAISRTRDRAAHSLALAKASGGNLSEGALAQLTGEVMEMVEEFALMREAGAEIDPQLLTSINKSLVAARAKELETQALALKEKQVAQKDTELGLKQDEFELRYVAAFIEHAGNKRAYEIAAGTGPKEVKMDTLRELLFGRKPEAVAA